MRILTWAAAILLTAAGMWLALAVIAYLFLLPLRWLAPLIGA